MASDSQTPNEPTSSDTEQYSTDFKTIQQLKDENTQLKTALEVFEQKETEYNRRIQELEDWNTDSQDSSSSNLQSQIELLTTRNRQLENDFQRLQSQQKNNQLAFERLDEYEETIAQLQEELDQLRSNRKPTKSSDDKILQEQTRLQIEQMKKEQEKIELDLENEKNTRELIEKQLIERSEEVQALENENQQLRNSQALNMTPGSPPTITSSSDSQILLFNNQQFNSLHEQFQSLLPSEFLPSDNPSPSLIDRFQNLFEQYSSYIGTFSIIQEELDSLKQILNEKQDDLEKLRTHLEFTTDQLTQIQEEKSLETKYKTFDDDSDEDELGEILRRAPSQQSLASITPGEKQQLIAQNELLSTLLNEKEQELISLQQADKTRFEQFKMNIQRIESEKELKEIELNDIKNILDEKLRENSSLKKEKMFFIEKISEFERLRQEQPNLIQISSKQSTPEREKSPSTTKTYAQLLSEYDQLVELSARQHEESLTYYNEYTRILALYNELNTKSSQLQTDYQSMQSLIQQKTEAYLSCQNELNTFQNLFYQQKKKSEDIEQLHLTLNEREIQLERLKLSEEELLNKQSQLEANLKLLQEQNTKMISNEKYFQQSQLDLKRVSHERDLAIIEKKQLEKQQSENESEINKHQEQISTITRLNGEVHQLRIEIDGKTKQLAEFTHNVQTSNHSRVEKQLVKNILLSYFNTPIDKQQEVVPLLGALVGFTQEEYQKAIEALANNYNNTTSSSWLTGWLGSNSTKTKFATDAPVYNPEKSFAELLIQYVDHQSPENSPESVLNTGTTPSNPPTQFI